MENERQFLVPFAELVDRLTVDQIKEVLLQADKKSFADEMKRISHDIDLIVKQRQITLSARLLRIVAALAQMNLHIWYLKDKMQEDETHYNDLLKKAHQLNGIRNRLKNLLLEEVGEKEKASERSNFNTDGLEGWDVSIS